MSPNMNDYINQFLATKDMAKAAGTIKDSDRTVVARHDELMAEARQQFEFLHGVPARDNDLSL